MVRLALQQRDEERQRLAGPGQTPSQRGKLQCRLTVCRHRVERGSELLLRLPILPFGFEQQGELQPRDGEIRIELNSVSIRGDGAVIVADGAGDVTDLLLDVGTCWRDPARSAQQGERARRVAAIRVARRGQHQHVHVFWRDIQQLVGDLPRFVGAPQADEGPRFPEHRRSKPAVDLPRFAIAFERFAVQSLLRENTAE